MINSTTFSSLVKIFSKIHFLGFNGYIDRRVGSGCRWLEVVGTAMRISKNLNLFSNAVEIQEVLSFIQNCIFCWNSILRLRCIWQSLQICDSCLQSLEQVFKRWIFYGDFFGMARVLLTKNNWSSRISLM